MGQSRRRGALRARSREEVQHPKEIVLAEQLDRVATYLVRVLKALRLTDVQIVSAIVDACRREHPRPVPNPVGGHGGVLGAILWRWSEDPKFVDEDGRPKVIPIRGAGVSFAELVRKSNVRMSVSSSLERLIRMSSVARVGRSKVRLLNPAMNYCGRGMTLIEEVLVPIEELLHTVAWNVTEQVHGGKPGVFQRGVADVEIPIEDLDELQRRLALHGMSLLEAMDAWANQRASIARASRRKNVRWVRPYIGIFLSTGAANKSRRGSGRLRMPTAGRTAASHRRRSSADASSQIRLLSDVESRRAAQEIRTAAMVRMSGTGVRQPRAVDQ